MFKAKLLSLRATIHSFRYPAIYDKVSKTPSDVVSETASDIASETASDAASETAADVASETASDVVSETASDAASETTSDVASETASDVVSETASEELRTGETSSTYNQDVIIGFDDGTKDSHFWAVTGGLFHQIGNYMQVLVLKHILLGFINIGIS